MLGDSITEWLTMLLGEELQRAIIFYDRTEKRDCFEQIMDYLLDDEYGRVCLVYGLRRTGKTTMLFQAVKPHTTQVACFPSVFSHVASLEGGNCVSTIEPLLSSCVIDPARTA